MKGYKKRNHQFFLWLFILCFGMQAFGQPNPYRGLNGPCDNSKISSGGWGGHNIICEDGRVFETPDSGVTWKQVNFSENLVARNLAMQKIANGYNGNGSIVGNNGTIFSTSDNGRHWVKTTSVTTSNLNNLVYSYCPGTQQSWGYAVGDNSTVLVSKDGGKTWTKQSTPYQYDHFYGVHFYNGEIGWIVGSMGIIYKTINSGTTWAYVEGDHSNPTYKGVAFTSSDSGNVVGSDGFIGRTTNGGTTWEKQNSGTTETLNDIAFADSDTGAAVGNGGTLLNTTDGGNSWAKQDLGTTSNLNDVTYDLQGYIWIAGDNGALFTNNPRFFAPTAPSNLTASPKGGDEIDLAWLDNSNNEAGFIIERKEGSEGQWVEGDTVNMNQHNYEDKELKPNTNYYYRVSSYNSAGESSYSNEATAKTSNAIPSAPSNLTASPKGGNEIDLAWLDNSNNEDGFIIERKEGLEGQWAEGDTVNMNQHNYEDKELKPNTNYSYRVSAYNSAGKSSCSNEASAKTYDTTSVAPTDLKATTINSSQIDLSWLDKATNETGYKVERKTGQNPFAEIVTLNPNSTTHSDKNLDDGLNYIYRVASFNTVGKSGYSNEGSAITTLNSPTNLTVKKSTSGGSQLDWKDNSKSESGFTVEKKLGAGTFSKLTDVPSNTITFSDGQVGIGQQLFYRVQAYNNIIVSGYSNTADIVITSVKSEIEIPSEYSLKQNYPNPFNPETIISYELPEAGYVTLKIFDILGNEMVTLVNDFKSAGKHYSILTTTDSKFTSGCYIYKLIAGSFSSVRKMLLIK